MSADDYDDMVSSHVADDDEDDMSAGDYNDMVSEHGLDELENVEQCKDDIADGGKAGAISTGLGTAASTTVATMLTSAVSTVTAVAATVAATVGGWVTGATQAAMTSEACAAAPQELGEFVSSLDPSELERQMEEISMSTAPAALEGR